MTWVVADIVFAGIMHAQNHSATELKEAYLIMKISMLKLNAFMYTK